MAETRDYQREDDEARARIREMVDRTMFVEAGAGTGKTSALVDRFVALVLADHPVERIVAITFTEKAAAEMRDRVRSGLEEALTKHPEREEVIRRALSSLDRAPVSTIHSFGQSLLRAYAAEAAIDPGFQVLDEMQAERRRQEQWRACLEQMAADPDAAAIIDRALGLGLTTRHLETLARELTAIPDLAPRLAAAPLVVEPAMWPDLRSLAGRLGALAATPPDSNPKHVSLDRLRAFVEAVAAAGADADLVLAGGSELLTKTLTGVASYDRVAANEVREELNATLAALRAEALAALLPLIVRFVLDDARARGREGTLNFDDLILRPRDLLQSPAAAAALRERYDTLLIDEFQDTDPLQVDIARAFATDPATRRLEPGRLFLVGDPKQSIYRFRRADMAVYSRTSRQVSEAGAQNETLAVNRRSRQVILEWVNHVFAALIGAGARPAVQPKYVGIHWKRTADLEGPGVAWFGGAAPKDMRAREVRRLAAAELAAHCRAVVEQGWQVQERGGEIRQARFRDIAILIQTRAILAPLERALAGAAIPYRVEGGSLIYGTQEVRDLTNCLTAIDDPADEVAVVAALRSPAFACSDVDLARFRGQGGRFDYLRLRDGTGGPVADGLQVLAEYHRTRHDQPLAALVERFVAERGLVETGLLHRADRNSFRRMRFVAEQARAFEANGPESLRAFVGWLEQRATSAILDYEGAGVDDDEDAVRVLTIHGAKGLEFPVVFVAGIGGNPDNRTPAYLLDRTGERAAVSIGSKTANSCFQLGPVDDLHTLEKDHAEAELQRLLYVACTRARDHLVVCLHHPHSGARSGARLLIEAGGCEPALRLPQPQPLAAGDRRPFPDLEPELPNGITEQAFAAARAGLVATATRRRYTSATALGSADMRKEEATDESEPWVRGRAGTRLGRAVHAALQAVSLDAGDDEVDAVSRAQAVAEAIPDRAGDVARLVRRALASDAAGRARTALRALREVPFAAALDGGVVLEGFIDLVIETADGLEIVDWKTDAVPAAAVPARLREYELQAGLYVLGLEAATGRQATRVTYAFVGAGVEASPGEPAALAVRARDRLAQALPPGPGAQ